MPTRRYPALYGDRGAGGGARGRRLLPVFAQLPPLARGSPQPPPHPPPRRAQSPAGRGPCSSPARTCGPPPPPAGGRWGGVVVVVRGATPPPAAATAAGLPRGDTRGRYRSSPAAAAPRCPAGPGALPHSRRWQVRRAAAAGGGGARPSHKEQELPLPPPRGGGGGPAAGPAPAGPAPQRGRPRPAVEAAAATTTTGGLLPAGVAPKTLTTGTRLVGASRKWDWQGSRPGSGLPM